MTFHPAPRKSIFKSRKKWYTVGVDRTTLIDFFEEVETTEEYNGYFCSIAEAVGIVVLGSLCGFRNVSQIHHWAENARVKELLKEKFQIAHIPCYFWLLTLLKMVKPDTLNECMMKWASQFMPENRNGTTTSLDGKTIRSTVGRKSMDSPLHIISAQICEIGVAIYADYFTSQFLMNTFRPLCEACPECIWINLSPDSHKRSFRWYSML